MRLRRMRDEPLRAAGVFPRQSHADGAAIIRHHVYLAADRPPRAAVAVASGIAVLHYEIRHDAMNLNAIEIMRLGEFYEIIDGQRSVFG